MNSWFASLLILFLFFSVGILVSIQTGLKKIEENWHKDPNPWKCNPMYMPLAGYVESENRPITQIFNDCVNKEMDTDKLLGPIYGSLSMAMDTASAGMGAIGSAANAVSENNMGFMSVFGKIGTMVKNATLYFRIVLSKVVSIFSKLAATFTVFTYMGETFAKTMASTTDSNLFSVLTAGASCIKGNTPIRLQNGELRHIKDLKEGDVLEGDVTVKEVIEADGSPDNPYYKIYSHNLQKYIYVTGNHLIYDELTDGMIEVRYYSKAIKTDKYDEKVYCLITSNHLIPIGEISLGDCHNQIERDDVDTEFGACFAGQTLVTMDDGGRKAMSELVLGDRLAYNNEVIAVMQIKGGRNNPYYKIRDEITKQDILVTGTHKIRDPYTGIYKDVRHVNCSERTKLYDDVMYCIVTTSHQIPIGNHVFWDWEDDLLSV